MIDHWGLYKTNKIDKILNQKPVTEMWAWEPEVCSL